MNDFDYYVFTQNNKLKGADLWFALKAKDNKAIDDLIEDGFVPAILEKIKLALSEECFSEAEALKMLLLDIIGKEDNPTIYQEANVFLDSMIEEAKEGCIIV